jgi:hypothetical protein
MRNRRKHTVRGYALIVGPLAAIFRLKQNDFAEAGRWFAFIPDRMAETERAEVYGIHRMQLPAEFQASFSVERQRGRRILFIFTKYFSYIEVARDD